MRDVKCPKKREKQQNIGIAVLVIWTGLRRLVRKKNENKGEKQVDTTEALITLHICSVIVSLYTTISLVLEINLFSIKICFNSLYSSLFDRKIWLIRNNVKWLNYSVLNNRKRMVNRTMVHRESLALLNLEFKKVIYFRIVYEIRLLNKKSNEPFPLQILRIYVYRKHAALTSPTQMICSHLNWSFVLTMVKQFNQIRTIEKVLIIFVSFFNLKVSINKGASCSISR